MFTQTFPTRVRRGVLRSPLVNVLAGPHGIDSYTELVDRSWTGSDARAAVVEVRRQTPGSVTLTLEPNRIGARMYSEFRAGRHLNVTVEIDGRRHTRCYSPAGAEGSTRIELTVGRREGGRVSSFLCDHARRGMVVGIGPLGGDFTLDGPLRRVLLVSGGTGITPVMSMLRTLRAAGEPRNIAFLHYARTPADLCYARELDAMHDVRVRYGYTRAGRGDVQGHVTGDHLAEAMPLPDAVYVCGPRALVDAVRRHHPDARSESFQPPVFARSSETCSGRVFFTDSGIAVVDDGRPLLQQAESAGLTPDSGCRMGICHTCTRRKTRGTVRNLTTGAVSTADAEDVQICVSVPLGDVEVAL